MTKEFHILDLVDVREVDYDRNMLRLTFTGKREVIIPKYMAEGIVTWMLANEDQGGYYPLVFNDSKLTAGRPHRHRHANHKARLRNVRYYFREWFACEAELKRTKTEHPGIAIAMPNSAVRVKRLGTPGWDNGSTDWHLEHRIWFPVNNFDLSPELKPATM